jgi:hypothetical protein
MAAVAIASLFGTSRWTGTSGAGSSRFPWSAKYAATATVAAVGSGVGRDGIGLADAGAADGLGLVAALADGTELEGPTPGPHAAANMIKATSAALASQRFVVERLMVEAPLRDSLRRCCR